METPSQLRSVANKREDIAITHREYDEKNVIAVDFGPDVMPSLDIVGESVIVVAGDRQFEFERPAEATDITTNDGMLIIKE